MGRYEELLAAVCQDGADLVCASNDDRQSALSYNAINTMRGLVDPRELDTKRTQTNLLRRG